MAAIIRPRRVQWPSLFWERAAGSYADNDLTCRDCFGRGYGVPREEAWEGITAQEVACQTCMSSGLLVPVRTLPDDIEEMWSGDEAGAGWLAWMGHEGDGLLWPAPWCWTISRKRFGIRREVYVGGGEVLAFMSSGSVVVGLHELNEDSRDHLEAVFRVACGEAAEVPRFVVPVLPG